MSTTDKNLKIAFADECQTSIEYRAYAHKAVEEGLIEVAQLFLEAAASETIHALSHLKAMNVVGKTSDNLAEAIEGEGLEILSIYPKFIEEAEQEGNSEAAKSFRIAYERERHHHGMFRQMLKELKNLQA